MRSTAQQALLPVATVCEKSSRVQPMQAVLYKLTAHPRVLEPAQRRRRAAASPRIDGLAHRSYVPDRVMDIRGAAG